MVENWILLWETALFTIDNRDNMREMHNKYRAAEENPDCFAGGGVWKTKRKVGTFPHLSTRTARGTMCIRRILRNYTKFYVFHRHSRAGFSVGSVDSRLRGGARKRWISRVFHCVFVERVDVENSLPHRRWGKAVDMCRNIPRKRVDFPMDIHGVIHRMVICSSGYPQPVEKWCGKVENACGVGYDLWKTRWKVLESAVCSQELGCLQSIASVLDVLDDLIHRRFKDGIRRQAALHHGDIGVDGAVVACERRADLGQR